MRLNEFTDPTDYIPTDAANLLEQIESLWPVGTRDDDAPLVIRPRQRSQNDRPKTLDER